MHHRGYEPHILYAEDVWGEMEKELRSHTSCYKVFGEKNDDWFYSHFRYITPNKVRRAVRYISELQPDIIHIHYGVDMSTFSDVLRKVDIPVVVSFYGYDCTSFPKRFYGLGGIMLKRNVFSHKNLKAVFAMSPDMKKDLLLIGCPENLIRVHYYGTECSRFASSRDYSSRNEVRFTIISGLSEKKGHLVLLDAWKLLTGMTRQNLLLTIIGNGEMKEILQNRIKEEKIANIVMKEAVKYGSQEHYEALKETDVFVHPSITASNGDKEGIPGAIIEAMANGLPVISTRHAGIPYVLEQETMGLLVEENNAIELAHSMKRLAEDSSLRERMGRTASSYALANLDILIKEDELESLYSGIIASLIHQKKLKL